MLLAGKWRRAFGIGSRLLENARADVGKCEEHVKTELGVLHKEVTDATHTLLSEQQANEIKRWISPIAFAEIHESIMPMQGTCEWIFWSGVFDAWLDDSQSCAIWLRGGIGTGKTYLTHEVIEILKCRLARHQRAKLAY